MKLLTPPLSARHKGIVGLFALVCANFLAYCELVLSDGLNFSYLYLLPVFLASWFASRAMGITVGIWASAVWFAGEMILARNYANASTPMWNLLTRAGAFVASAAILAQLRAKFEEMSKLAARDFLTGLPNGNAFYELAASEMNQASSTEPLTLATILVTGVQMVNYRFGYSAGDRVLCTIAKTIQQQAPRPDLVGRMGGTSFSVLLPNTTSENAHAILQKIHEALDVQRHQFAGPVTFCFSAIACAESTKTLAELLYQADNQMESIKVAGKDHIQISPVEDTPALN